MTATRQVSRRSAAVQRRSPRTSACGSGSTRSASNGQTRTQYQSLASQRGPRQRACRGSSSAALPSLRRCTPRRHAASAEAAIHAAAPVDDHPEGRGVDGEALGGEARRGSRGRGLRRLRRARQGSGGRGARRGRGGAPGPRRASEPHGEIAARLGREDGAADLPAQASDVAHPHRPEHLEELVAPAEHEIDDAGRAPPRVGAAHLERAGSAGAALVAHGAAHRDEERHVHDHRVGSEDDRLGHVLGRGDPAGRHQGERIAQPPLDQREMGLSETLEERDAVLASAMPVRGQWIVSAPPSASSSTARATPGLAGTRTIVSTCGFWSRTPRDRPRAAPGRAGTR